MATLTAYSGTADGDISSTNATYSTARSGSSLAAVTNGTSIRIGQQRSAAGAKNYSCYESFISFDTSSIGSTSNISSATLSLYGQNDQSVTDFTINARYYDWGATLTTADWIAGASLSGNTLFGTFSTSGFSTTAYNDFTTSSFASISKTASTLFVLSSSRHEAGTTPADAPTYEYVNVYAADQTGTTNDPKLVVIYTTDYTLTPSLVTNTNTFYEPTLTKSNTLTPSLFTNTNTFYSHTITKLNTLTASLVTNTNTFYNTTLTKLNNITVPLVTNTNSFYNPILSFFNSIVVPITNNTNTLYTLDLTNLNTITTSLVSNNNYFYEPQLSYTNDVIVNITNNVNYFYNPNVSYINELLISLYSNTNTFYQPLITSSYTLVSQTLINTNTFFNPTVISIYSLETDLVSNTNTFYNPLITTSFELIQNSTYVNTNTFFTSTVTSLYSIVQTSIYINSNSYFETTLIIDIFLSQSSIFENQNEIYNHTVITAGGLAQSEFFENINEFYNTSVSYINYINQLDTFNNTNSFYNYTLYSINELVQDNTISSTNNIYTLIATSVYPLNQTLLITNNNLFYTHSILAQGSLEQDELYINNNNFYEINLSNLNSIIQNSTHTNINYIYLPTVLGTYDLTQNQTILNSNQIYTDTIELNNYINQNQSIENNNQYYTHVLNRYVDGSQTINSNTDFYINETLTKENVINLVISSYSSLIESSIDKYDSISISSSSSSVLRGFVPNIRVINSQFSSDSYSIDPWGGIRGSVSYVTASVGDELVVLLSIDNSGTSGTITFDSFETNKVSWNYFVETQSPTSTPEDGIVLVIAYGKVTQAINNEKLYFNFTGSNSHIFIDGIFYVIRARNGSSLLLRDGPLSDPAETSTPSITSNTIFYSDLVIGTLVGRGLADYTVTQDQDSNSYSKWKEVVIPQGYASSIYSEYKLVEDVGTQTFNPSLSDVVQTVTSLISFTAQENVQAIIKSISSSTINAESIVKDSPIPINSSSNLTIDGITTKYSEIAITSQSSTKYHPGLLLYSSIDNQSTSSFTCEALVTVAFYSYSTSDTSFVPLYRIGGIIESKSESNTNIKALAGIFADLKSTSENEIRPSVVIHFSVIQNVSTALSLLGGKILSGNSEIKSNSVFKNKPNTTRTFTGFGLLNVSGNISINVIRKITGNGGVIVFPVVIESTNPMFYEIVKIYIPNKGLTVRLHLTRGRLKLKLDGGSSPNLDRL